jgi:uncharacterized membrane protein
VVLAAVNDNVYRLLFLLHIAAIVVAFAPMVIHPVFGAQSKADGEGAMLQAARHMADNERRIHFPALIAAGIFGLGLIFSSDEAWKFDQTWVSLSLLVWLALCGVVSGLIMPNERKLAAGDLEAEKKVAMGGQIATVLFLVMLYLMIWKPGL